MRYLAQQKGILLSIVFYFFCCIVMLLSDFNFLYLMLAWNVFLAYLPLLFISVAKNKLRQKFFYVFVFLWLIFFPNAVYMITDFIHISGDVFISAESATYTIIYSKDIFIWAKLFLIGAGFLLSAFLGLESLYILEQCLSKFCPSPVVFAETSIACLLAGTGVYIGRFLRYNSWDIFFNPLEIIQNIMFDMFAFRFIIIFWVFLLFLFYVYKIFKVYGIQGLKNNIK